MTGKGPNLPDPRCQPILALSPDTMRLMRSYRLVTCIGCDHVFPETRTNLRPPVILAQKSAHAVHDPNISDFLAEVARDACSRRDERGERVGTGFAEARSVKAAHHLKPTGSYSAREVTPQQRPNVFRRMFLFVLCYL